MPIAPVTFKSALTKLSAQYIKERHAECTLDDFGGQTHKNAREFFSIALVEDDLPDSIAAVGTLLDDSAHILGRKSYTLLIYIDSSKSIQNITADLKEIIFKLIFSHEMCHFAFYYELFIDMGAELSTNICEEFQHIVSGRLTSAITKESDITSETVVDEHRYSEFIKNVWEYPHKHFTKGNRSSLNYASFMKQFFNYLTQI